MIVYEKENKLNINFENSVSETPDLQISKEDGKTSVTIDGQSGGGGVNPVIIEVTPTSDTQGTWSGATWEELMTAFNKNVAGVKIANTVSCHNSYPFCRIPSSTC